jgi:class 3 adenylate cyclase/tetratricopeptide (TPR) repeat protein
MGWGEAGPEPGERSAGRSSDHRRGALRICATIGPIMASTAETVTILFTDLVSSTELLQRAGDEQAQRVFKAHHRLLREAVEAHGGHEVKWLGDGLMVALPSAVDAVRCAIAMQQASHRPAAGERLEIRVGLNVGEAIRDESDYFGAAVVIARRLCDSAGGGQIFASDLVVRLLAGRQEFTFHDLGAMTLKGIAAPVGASEVLYEHDPLAMLARTPFVGRGEEMAALERRFDQLRAGKGGVTVLVGEPGIGKTRTAEEFCEHAQGLGATVLWGHCYEGDWAPPFSPFAEAIRQYAETADDAAIRSALGKDAGVIARLVPALRDRLPDIAEPTQLPAEGERYRLLETVSSFFGSVAAARPLILVLDDLHWADSGTMAMLRHVARQATGQRVLLLGAYRDVEVDAQHPLVAALPELRREAAFERVALRGLENPDVGRLLSVIAEQDVPDELVQAIAHETEGNPFFIREVLLHLIEEGKVLTEDGRWRATLSIADVGIPETVREVIGHRLSRLSEAANRLLAAASAFDGGFAFDLVASVSGLDEAAALDAIDDGLAAHVLRPAGTADTYDFTHALFRHTLYEEMSPSRKVRLHRQIGEAIEARYAENLEPRLGELAYHFYRAAPAGDVAKAIDYCRRAGDQARARFACEDAVAHYQRAVEVFDLLPHPDEVQRCALLLDLGEAQSFTGLGKDAAAMDTFLNAADAARGTSDADAFARAAVGYHDASIWVSFGSSEHFETKVVPLLREAARLLGNRRDAPMVKILARLGWALHSAGHSDEGLSVCYEAVGLARTLGDPTLLAFVLDGLNEPLWRPDRLEQRLAIAREVVELAAQGSDRERQMFSHAWMSEALLEAGDVELAHRHFAEFGRYAHDLHIPATLYLHKVTAAMWAYLRGDLRAGEALSLDAFSFGQKHVGMAAERHLAQLFYLYWERDRLAERLPAQRPLPEERANQPWAAAVRAVLGFRCAESGDLDGAREQLEILTADDCAGIPFDQFWLSAVTFVAETAARLGSEHCATLYRLLAPYPDQNVVMGGASVCLGSSSRPLGLLAAALHRWDEAERHFADALAMNSRMGARPWVARTQFNYAQMLLAREEPGDREKARGLLQEALGAAQQMELVKLARDCEGLLPAVGHA